MLNRMAFWLFVLSVFSAQESQAQFWVWAKESGAGVYNGLNHEQLGKSLSTDLQGNVYIVGTYSGPDIIFETTVLGAQPYSAVFLAKYDPNGHVLWAKNFGGLTDNIACRSVCTDLTGNVFVTGRYTGSLAFGPVVLPSPAAGAQDIFLAKFDSSGNTLWAESGGGDGIAESNSVSTDSAGNAYITGCFSHTYITIGATTLINAGVQNVFLAKYDSHGNAGWAKSVAGQGYDNAYGVSANKNGDVSIGGDFTSAILTFGTISIHCNGNANMYLARFDAQGNVLWANDIPVGVDYRGLAMCTDQSNNTYLTSYFGGPSLVLGSVKLLNGGDNDLFFVKYDALGNVLWAQNAGEGAGAATEGHAICTDWKNNVYVSGFFYKDATFGSQTLSYQPGPDGNAFLVKCDSAGKYICVSGLGGGGNDELAVCADTFGHVYLGGHFDAQSLTVGSVTLPIAPGVSGENAFVAKYTCGCTSVGHITGINKLCKGESSSLLANGGSTYSWNTGASTGNISVTPDSTTTYSVVCKYGGCSDTAFKKITVYPLPVNEIVSQQTVDLCEGGHNGSITTSTTSGTVPYTFSWSPGGETTESISGLGAGVYALSVVDAQGCKTKSVTVQVMAPQLFVPNYFSPNDDGMNDKECIFGSCFKDIHFTIYDRWGEKVFETSDINMCWDGSYRGMPMETQIFVYKIEATLISGEIIAKKGTINLGR